MVILRSSSDFNSGGSAVEEYDVALCVVVVVNFTEKHDNNLKTDDTTHTHVPLI